MSLFWNGNLVHPARDVLTATAPQGLVSEATVSSAPDEQDTLL